MTGEPGVRLVGVHPPEELERRSRLFAALAEAVPVRFEGRAESEWVDLDALVEIGGSDEAKAAASTGVRALALLADEAEQPRSRELMVSHGAALDRRLRGAALPETWIGPVDTLRAGEADEVLASIDGRAVWTRTGSLDAAVAAPLELDPDEPLRRRFARERSGALLPLLHLLRVLTAGEGWRAPPLRATFLLDDPNLHWPSYGFVRLPQLARHAARHRYHLALAMVPLDAWFAHRGATRALRESPALTLAVHGNDHFGGELGRIADPGEALAVAAQALRRVSAFERRHGVEVARVMVPPHEECSAEVVEALARVGFDAITMTRPYPWLSPLPRHWLTAPAGVGPLTGWLPADFTPGNLPVLLRHPLGPERSHAELVLRAYLDQPLIVYGHHDDLAGGLELLEVAAGELNRFGDVRWSSLSEIAASNFETRRDGALLHVRPFARRMRVEVPEGVEALALELPPGSADASLERGALGEPLPVEGPGVVQITLERRDAIDPGEVPGPPRNVRAVARRLAGEGRDRSLPLVRRLARR